MEKEEVESQELDALQSDRVELKFQDFEALPASLYGFNRTGWN